MSKKASEFKLLDLPGAVLRNVTFCTDGQGLAKLSMACKALNTLADDQDVWKQLLLKRFGKTVLPGLQPTLEQSRPVELDGWVFYQGLDGSEASDKQHPEAGLAQLAQLAKDAEAFTTCSKVIPCLVPQGQWARTSFRPADGMYVREAVVAARELDPPEAGAGGAEADHPWLPHVPGWVYFPSCISPYPAIDEPPATLARHKSMKTLLAESMARPNVVAVSTAGETKARLWPQVCWRVQPAYDVGLYVREAEVQQAGLVPDPQVPNYRQLYAKLHKPRLDAAQMGSCWLNDNYLTLTHSPDSPADSGITLYLNYVWWLDVSGSIPGVPPGDYHVLWIVDVTETIISGVAQSADIKLSAEAKPVQHTNSSSSGSTAASPAAAAAAAADPSADAAAGSNSSHEPSADTGPMTAHIPPGQLFQLKARCRGQGVRWGALSGGVLHVRDYSTVHLRFWATENAWKARMRWAYAELVPVSQAGAEQAAEDAAAAANAAAARAVEAAAAGQLR